MLGVVQRCLGLLPVVKVLNQREKGMNVTKASQETYNTVIKDVKKSKGKYIFIFDPDGQLFKDTHKHKQDQGYYVMQQSLLNNSEPLPLNDHQKVVMYISIDLVTSTYEDRGEALSRFLHFLTEKRKIRPIHLVFYQFNQYPIPHMEQFLQESKTYNIQTSIVVESHSVLQNIYGKQGAQRITTSCHTTTLA